MAKIQCRNFEEEYGKTDLCLKYGCVDDYDSMILASILKDISGLVFLKTKCGRHLHSELMDQSVHEKANINPQTS